MPKDNYILVRSLVEDEGRNRKQRVEPSSCLVYRLGDKICRELLPKELFIFKWIVMLCEWHGTAVKPAVNDFRYTVHLFSTFRTANRHPVNIRTVKLDILRTVV